MSRASNLALILGTASAFNLDMKWITQPPKTTESGWQHSEERMNAAIAKRVRRAAKVAQK